MKIFKKDFKDNLKSAIIWTLSAGLMGFFTVSIYDSMIASSIDEWNKMMATMPKAMLDAFEISEFTFTDILSYYAMEGYLYVALILSMFAALLGVKLINKEESEQTTEFVLTKPISRVDYITQKLLTFFTFVTIANVVTEIIVYIGMMIGSKESIPLDGFMVYCIGIYLITLAFGTIAFTIACFIKRNKGLTGPAIGLVFLSFFLGILANLTDSLTNLKYLSLFEYMDPRDILNDGISLTSGLLFAFLIIGSVILAYRIYLKKDIYN